jgi:hypothetical protein
MVIKDNLVSWFIRNLVMPKNEIIDNPGFIVTQFTDRGKNTFLRELFYPEQIFVDLEKRIIEKYGDTGKQILYSSGKKFGYSYSAASNFSKINSVSKKDFEGFVYLFMRYAECMWANKLSHKMDYSTTKFEAEMDNYIICKKNGCGYLMMSGTVGGFWSYMCEDSSIESIHPKCQGRGDGKCVVLCAPKMYLNGKIFEETDLRVLDSGPKYREINKIRKTDFATASFKDLIYSKLFKQEKGVISHAGFRHFLCESSMFYFLEKELAKLKDGEAILFDSAFDYGKALASEQGGAKGNMKKYAMDYMSAIGWGDLLISIHNNKYSCVSKFFPWTELASEVHFVLFRGLVSGLLSAYIGRDVRLTGVQTNLLGNFLTVKAYEE